MLVSIQILKIIITVASNQIEESREKAQNEQSRSEFHKTAHKERFEFWVNKQGISGSARTIWEKTMAVL